jgi:hypothetical protein
MTGRGGSASPGRPGPLAVRFVGRNSKVRLVALRTQGEPPLLGHLARSHIAGACGGAKRTYSTPDEMKSQIAQESDVPTAPGPFIGGPDRVFRITKLGGTHLQVSWYNDHVFTVPVSGEHCARERFMFQVENLTSGCVGLAATQETASNFVPGALNTLGTWWAGAFPPSGSRNGRSMRLCTLQRDGLQLGLLSPFLPP